MFAPRGELLYGRESYLGCFFGGGASSPPTYDHPSKEVASNGPSMLALVRHGKELELGRDFFMWLHPSDSGEALFVVDDATERAMREVAS